MHSRYALLATLIAGATTLPQASPSTSAPPGCTPDFDGTFHIAVINITETPTSSGTPVSQIGDGQLQAQPSAGICQISDGQLQVPSGGATLVNQSSDGQLQVLRGDAVTQIGDGQLQSTGGSNPCESTLDFTLANGVIKDAENRILNIVANHQLQADNPLQAGSLYSTGFSICSNSSLALMSSTVFYQCSSGTFFNLYDEPAGADCNPVTISTFESSPASA
jgi:hypothetical protein